MAIPYQDALYLYINPFMLSKYKYNVQCHKIFVYLSLETWLNVRYFDKIVLSESDTTAINILGKENS